MNMDSGDDSAVWYPEGMNPCILGFTNGTFPNGSTGHGTWQFGHYIPTSAESSACQAGNDPWTQSLKYGHYTTYFLIIALGLAMIIGTLKRMDSIVRSLGYLSPFHFSARYVAFYRALSYKQFHKGPFSIPPLGPLSLLVVFFSFGMAYTWGIRPYYRPPNFGSSPLGLRSEWIATAMMPWMYALAMKKNLFRVLTGTTLETTQILHRWSPWICLFFSLVHTVAMCIRALRQAPWTYTWKTNIVYWNGTAAIVPLAWLCFSGFPIVRHYVYRLWYFFHICAAILFLVFMYIHCAKEFDTWVYLHVTAAVFGASWIFQYCLALYHSFRTKATIRLLSGNILEIQIPLNGPTSTRINSWSPGQHVLIRFWSIKPFESHPFTICSVPSDGNMTFLAKIQHPRGLTRKLFNLASSSSPKYSNKCSLPVLLDGPYGGVGDVGEGLRSADSALLIAGGMGITFALSIFRDLIKCECANKECGQNFQENPTPVALCRNVHLVWTAKSYDVIESFAKELQDVMDLLPAYVTVSLHVTNQQSQQESSVESGKKESQDSTIRDMNIKYCRPNIAEIIKGESMDRQNKLGVAVCGPPSLTRDTRDAVARAQWQILRNRTGVTEMELWDEMFRY